VRIQVGKTIADGQQAATPGELTWPIIRALASEVVTVTDGQILDAMRFAFERMKLVVEPSGASAFAALLGGTYAAEGQRVGVVLSGGNIGADAFGKLLAR
jgi:threonine dehydratase